MSEMKMRLSKLYEYEEYEYKNNKNFFSSCTSWPIITLVLNMVHICMYVVCTCYMHKVGKCDYP